MERYTFKCSNCNKVKPLSEIGCKPSKQLNALCKDCVKLIED